MGTIASQITRLTIVYSTVYSDADQRKHQSSASLAFVRGIHRGPMNSPHKGPVTRKMFPFDDVIMLWLIVHVSIPLFILDEPTMLTMGRQYHAWPGQTRTFNCTANGLPEPDITWFRGHEYLRANETYMIVGKRRSSILQVNWSDPVSQETHYVMKTYFTSKRRFDVRITFQLRRVFPGITSCLCGIMPWISTRCYYACPVALLPRRL